jgi:hypothetical protein
LNSLFIYCTLKWIRSTNKSALPALAFIGGFITLIRPTGICVFLFPLLFDVKSFTDIKRRLLLLIQKPSLLILSIILFVLPMSVQMLFWKMNTGEFLYWSYHGERFFFDDPQISNFLFSYRKGWFVYTPVMLFAIIGLIISWWKNVALAIPVTIMLFLSVYILSSWWEWSYGGSFGCRAMVEFYAFLVFPFASFVSFVWHQKFKIEMFERIAKCAMLVLFFICIKLNFWQMNLFRWKVIHWSGMNKETYWYIMSRDTFTTKDYNYLYSKFKSPDHDKMRKGIRDL